MSTNKDLFDARREAEEWLRRYNIIDESGELTCKGDAFIRFLLKQPEDLREKSLPELLEVFEFRWRGCRR